MATDKKPMTDEAQQEFESYIASLVDKGELSVPVGIVLADPQAAEISHRGDARWASFLSNLTRLFMQPAPAYAFVLLLIYPAYRGMFQKPAEVTRVVKEREIAGGFGTTRGFSLEIAGQRGGGAEEQDVTIGSRDQFVTLSFFVAEEPNRRYDLRIIDEKGALVAEQQGIVSRDRLGNFSVVCSRSLFKSGSYLLSVLQVNGSSTKAEHEHRFRFKVRFLEG